MSDGAPEEPLPGMQPVVEMLLAAWGAAVGVPAFVTSNLHDILGSAPRTFRQWASDHAAAFAGQR